MEQGEERKAADAPNVLHSNDTLEFLARRHAVDDRYAHRRLLGRQTGDGADDLEGTHGAGRVRVRSLEGSVDGWDVRASWVAG